MNKRGENFFLQGKAKALPQAPILKIFKNPIKRDFKGLKPFSEVWDGIPQSFACTLDSASMGRRFASGGGMAGFPSGSDRREANQKGSLVQRTSPPARIFPFTSPQVTLPSASISPFTLPHCTFPSSALTSPATFPQVTLSPALTLPPTFPQATLSPALTWPPTFPQATLSPALT